MEVDNKYSLVNAITLETVVRRMGGQEIIGKWLGNFYKWKLKEGVLAYVGVSRTYVLIIDYHDLHSRIRDLEGDVERVFSLFPV